MTDDYPRIQAFSRVQFSSSIFHMFNMLTNMGKPKHAAIITDAREIKFADKIFTDGNRWQNWENFFPSENFQLCRL